MRTKYIPTIKSALAFIVLSLGIIVVLIVSSTVSTYANADKPDILVGEVGSFTGDKATYGFSYQNSLALAFDEINSNGGVLGGRKFKPVIEDDQSKAGQPAAVVKKVISNDKVVAIIGEFVSSLALEAAPICQASQVPLISPGATNEALTTKGDYIFRDCFVDSFQGTVMAKFALETLNVHNVAIMTAVNQDYSIGLAKAFQDYFTSHGGTIVVEKSYNSGDKDFRAQLTGVKAKNPEAIFLPGYYVEGGLIARQARALGITVPLLGGDGWDSPKLVQIGGPAVEGCYFSSHFSSQDQNPKIQNYVENYKKRFGVNPDAIGALSYDAVYLLADAMNRAGTTDGPAVREALATTKNFQGVTGSITIDQNRNPLKPAVIIGIKDGGPQYISTVMP